MPLLDHFHPPLSQRRHWESFHAAWATTLASALNEGWLPEGYFAEELITVGGRVEIDVATWEEKQGAAAATAVATRVWSPPVPTTVMPIVFPDSFEVLIYQSEGGPKLVAAVELISPGNKDRAEHRRACTLKCANYLQQGCGLVVVDIVTSRHANLHNEMVELLALAEDYRMDDGVRLYAVAYRPRHRDAATEVETWQNPLILGQPLPVLALALSAALCVPLDLESTYNEVCRLRLGRMALENGD